MRVAETRFFAFVIFVCQICVYKDNRNVVAKVLPWDLFMTADKEIQTSVFCGYLVDFYYFAALFISFLKYFLKINEKLLV